MTYTATINGHRVRATYETRFNHEMGWYAAIWYRIPLEVDFAETDVNQKEEEANAEAAARTTLAALGFEEE